MSFMEKIDHQRLWYQAIGLLTVACSFEHEPQNTGAPTPFGNNRKLALKERFPALESLSDLQFAMPLGFFASVPFN